MAKCVNCTTEALYEYRIVAGHSLSYCNLHLPKFLTEQKKAGMLTPTPAPVVETPEPVKAAKKKAVVEAPVEESPVVEEAVADDASDS